MLQRVAFLFLGTEFCERILNAITDRRGKKKKSQNVAQNFSSALREFFVHCRLSMEVQ